MAEKAKTTKEKSDSTERSDRTPYALIDLTDEVKGAPQAIVYRPNGEHFLSFLEDGDGYQRGKAIYPQIAVPAVDGKPTGDAYEADDIDKMYNDDVDAFSEILAECINMESAEAYEPDDPSTYDLLYPLTIGNERVKRIRFEPRQFKDTRQYRRAKSMSDRLRAYLQTMAVIDEIPEMAVGRILLKLMDAEDMARILYGHVGNSKRSDSKKWKRL